MKKVLSVLLSLVLMFSLTAVAFAEGADEPDYSGYVNIYFIVDGAEIGAVHALPGEVITQDIVNVAGNPSKEATDEVKYIFEGWYAAEAVDGEYKVVDGAEKQIASTFKAPTEAGDYYYVAVFYEESIQASTTLWSFFQSIFARINLIFEYFAKVFEGIIDFEN